MIPYESLAKLEARLFGEACDDVTLAIQSAEKLFPMPPRYRALLLEVGGAIMCDKGAIFKPDEKCPLSDREGYLDLVVLFGLGADDNSLEQKNSQYSGELPEAFVPIGESSGGNLICVDSDGAVHFWDHESPRDGATWRIAAGIDEFINRLEPDDSDLGSTEGIIKSIFLDF